MSTLAVMIQHSGRWNDEQIYEDYNVDAIALKENATFKELHELVISQIGVDLRYKYITMEYTVEGVKKVLQIHNDMSVRVYTMQKKQINEFNKLPLCVTLFNKEEEVPVINEVITRGEELGLVLHTTSNTDLVVVEEAEALNELNLDITNVMITNPSHNNIEVGQVYKDKETLKAVMKNYAERERFNFHVDKTNAKRYYLVCVSDKCSFSLRASCIHRTEWFKIQEFIPEHSCPFKDKLYIQKQATSRLVGRIIKSAFRNHKRKYNPKEIQEDMQEMYGLKVTYMIAWRAKEIALEELRGKPSASYQRLPPYLHMLNITYPGSHIRMKKTSENQFLYVFIALNASIIGFEHCRPVVVVDGSHLKGVYTGTFVSASTMDAAGHIFPLAYGVVDSKNVAAWTWFFEQLKEAYGERKGMSVVSDRNESIIKAVSQVYTSVPHFACIFHLWGNVTKKFKRSHKLLSSVFYSMANTYTQHEFDNLMTKVESVDIRVKRYLELAGYEKWSALYSPVRRNWTMTSNLAETINSKLVLARELPIYDFLEEVRKLFGKWNYEHRMEALQTFTTLAGTFQEKLNDNEALSTRMVVVPATEYVHSVRDGNNHFIVCLKNKTCTCMKFQVEEIPCEHACAVLNSKNLKTDEYCSDLYKPKTLLQIYDVPIYPMPSIADWIIPENVQEEVVMPPRYKRPAGRPPNMDRKKTAGEKAQKKSSNCCSSCGLTGHNSRSCRKRSRCI